MSDIYKDFLIYRDRFGLNQLKTNGTQGGWSQNGALFTMEYLICLLQSDDVFKHLHIQTEIERLKTVYKSLEVHTPGVSHRLPNSNEPDSMDNTVAIFAFSGCFDEGGFAKRSKIHGHTVTCTGIDPSLNEIDTERSRKAYPWAHLTSFLTVIVRPWLWLRWAKNKFRPINFWNNASVDKFVHRGWFGRSPGWLGMQDLVAQGYTHPFRYLLLIVGQFYPCFKPTTDLDGRKLPYVVWYFLINNTRFWDRWFWRLLYRLWHVILIKQYPNGMKDVYAGYYGDPNHPIRKYTTAKSLLEK